ncbi:LAFE_0A05974g1_1 [Lachancea fermentati]|uniref:LAFE_0A05974g1_1 n=1 Tax=Lachancea fermentati TaxID=4955 RepID=A0A1G4M738_LACFM|nr:LAFE_0A05974g1_1 [Lachancea fermentati]
MKFLLKALLFLLGLQLTISTLVQSGGDDDFPFTTVVDLLSHNVEFSTFLRVLQREGHIPLLNNLDNFTLLAPVNWAFTSEMVDNERLNLDNYILYDMVLDTEESLVGLHVLEGNHRFPMLLNRSSRLSDTTINGISIIEPNLRPNSQNATVHGLAALIDDVPTLEQLIMANDKNLRNFRGLFNSTRHLYPTLDEFFINKTLSLPEDSNFEESFNEIELEYLIGQPEDQSRACNPLSLHEKYSEWLRDKLFLMQKFIVRGVWGGSFSAMDLMNLNDDILHFSSKEMGSIVQVNGSSSFETNLIYEHGIVHTFRDFNFLRNGLHFNAEKYLIGLKSQDFIKEIYFRNLQHLINGEELSNLTIFVPRGSTNEVPGFSKSGLLYHFSESHIKFDDFPEHVSKSFSRFYDSMFCSSNKRLGGRCQRLKITKLHTNDQETFMINDKYLLKQQTPYEIGNTLIYMVDDALDLPGNLLSSINPFLHCSKSLKFLQDLNLLDLKPNNKGYTILLPCFDSWEYLGLDLEYLERNITALNLLMKNYILNGLIYSDMMDETLNTTTLEGDNITAVVHSPGSTSAEVELDLSTVTENITLNKGLDIIFDQGVIHPLNEVFFPEVLNITLRNLVDTTGNFDFLLFLESFESFAKILNENGPYSFLVPTPRSLLMEDINLNSSKLEDFLKLHIIPNNSTGAILECGENISTMFGEALTCRASSPTTYLLRLRDGLDKEVRILKKGCSSSNNKSCVFVIDRPFSLDWLNQERYRITLPGVAFAIGIVLGAVCIIALLMCASVVCIGRHKMRKAHDDEIDGDGERTPMNNPPQNNSSYSSIARQPHLAKAARELGISQTATGGQNFENSYSTNSSTNPILVSQT